MLKVAAPRIDILMATYNGGRFLAEQIDSILKDQTYKNVHLYIRDDSSQDGTCALICEKQHQYPGQITQVATEGRLGVVGNFSALMSYSNAEYVMFADQDDVWLPEKISQTMNAMLALQEIHGCECPLLVHTDLQVVDAGLRKMASSFWKYTKTAGGRCALNQLLIQNAVTGCTVMINRALLRLSQPTPPEAIMHDWWLGLVASAMGHIGVVQEATVLYRQHGRNEMGAKGFWQYYRQLFKPFRCHLQKLDRILLQGAVFADRYQAQLSDAQKKMLVAFCGLNQGYPWNRGYQMVKYKFWRACWMRTLHVWIGLCFSKKS